MGLLSTSPYAPRDWASRLAVALAIAVGTKPGVGGPLRLNTSPEGQAHGAPVAPRWFFLAEVATELANTTYQYAGGIRGQSGLQTMLPGTQRRGRGPPGRGHDVFSWYP